MIMKLRTRPEEGSALPVVFALVIGISALAAGYSMRTVRESQRATFNRNATEALYQSFAQLELVTYMVNTSGYTGSGDNAALAEALARGDAQFISPDGWPTGVFAVEQGTDSGFYEIRSIGSFPPPLADGSEAPGSVSRTVTALMRERQSFADFNTFVAQHTLGISGGQAATFPYADAPEGSVHSNDQIQFYFADRHFRDPVTAVNGFDYVAGANGPDHDDGSNQFFHGPVNEYTQAITGLTDVDTYGFNLDAEVIVDPDTSTPMSFDNQYDRVYLEFHGDTIEVEHYQSGHYETQEVTYEIEHGHSESTTIQVPDTEFVDFSYSYNVVDLVATEVTVTETITVDVFVEGGGGGEAGGAGGEGGVGYYIQVEQEVTYTETQMLPASPPTYTTITETIQIEQVTNPITYHDEVIETWVVDSVETVTEEQEVYVGWHREATYHVPADGIIYCRDDITIDRVGGWGDPYDVNVLDGKVTVVAGDNVRIRDSIVYGVEDDEGNLQTAYLNGDDHTSDYEPNPDYDGNSVLGIIARDYIEYQRYMPDEAEVNATMLAQRYQINADGIGVSSNGTVYAQNGGHTFVHTSLRRLGGIISNRRPVSAFIDENNAVTRGFIHGKTVFDRRQLTNPPIGFPTLNRPRILATVLKEVR